MNIAKVKNEQPRMERIEYNQGKTVVWIWADGTDERNANIEKGNTNERYERNFVFYIEKRKKKIEIVEIVIRWQIANKRNCW